MKITHPTSQEPLLKRRDPAGIASIVLLAIMTLSAPAAASSALGATSPPATGLEGLSENDETDESEVQTEPADGARLTRPARSLRVWFDRPPVVAESELSLVGPRGELQVEGLHTMGEDDLMARVVGAMPDGTYEASYSVTFADGDSLSGSWSFEIKRPGQAR